jgi:hypothetical protein
VVQYPPVLASVCHLLHRQRKLGGRYLPSGLHCSASSVSQEHRRADEHHR